VQGGLRARARAFPSGDLGSGGMPVGRGCFHVRLSFAACRGPRGGAWAGLLPPRGAGEPGAQSRRSRSPPHPPTYGFGYLPRMPLQFQPLPDPDAHGRPVQRPRGNLPPGVAVSAPSLGRCPVPVGGGPAGICMSNHWSRSWGAPPGARWLSARPTGRRASSSSPRPYGACAPPGIGLPGLEHPALA
jgi:hypothetical protein